jgi:hypothetical protein
MLYAVSRLVGTALQVALAKGWAASPPTMGWDLTHLDAIVMAANSAVDLGLIAGCLLLVAQRRAGLHLLRASICCIIALAVFGLISSIIQNPVLRGYWSTPAAGAQRGLSFLIGLWFPLLLAALTLLPLAPAASQPRPTVGAANVES